MFCIVALLVLSILSIFSATHRPLVKEAFDCVLRRVTLRPCTTGFREKVKGKILAQLIERSVLAAKLFNKYFEVLAWVFMILMIWSTFWTGRGLYNYFFYGSCNGLNKAGFCVLDPRGESNQISTSDNQSCGLVQPTEQDLTLAGVDLSLFPSLHPEAKTQIVFIGCYACDYTRKAYPEIRKLMNNKNVKFVYLHYPVKMNSDYVGKLSYCAYQQDQVKFWELSDRFYALPKDKITDHDYLLQVAGELGYKTPELKKCVESVATEAAVAKQIKEIEKTKVYGTPTVFIKGKPFVGPKPYRVYWLDLVKFW